MTTLQRVTAPANHLVIFYSHVSPKGTRQGHFVHFCLKHLLDTVPDNAIVRGGLVHDYPIKHPKFHNHFPLFTGGGGHPMILQQILTTLHAVRRQGWPIKYVSFAEHDNLYPKSHFQFEDFDEDVLINTNHAGFCVKGFQKPNETIWPTFAMTMKFDFALKFFASRLVCIFEDPDKYCKIEPFTNEVTDFNEWTILTRKNLTCTYKVRRTEEPILHMFNGSHNTSMPSVYSREEFASHDPYWGAASDLAEGYYSSWRQEIPDLETFYK